MNRSLYQRRWLRSLTIFERQLLSPVARARNAFINSAAAEYEKHGGIPRHVRMAHELKLQNLLASHYEAVIPHFGTMVSSQFKSRRGRLELKRMTFLSYMQDWVRKRALANASMIADTDSSDVRDAIDAGITDGLGTEAIASSIQELTGLSAYRAATIARTETNAAATFGAIEEARVTSQEIGIVLQKEWLPTMDDRTRPDHAAMANYGPIGLDEKFIVGGYEMDRPGDPSAPPELVINCRCSVSFEEAP